MLKDSDWNNDTRNAYAEFGNKDRQMYAYDDSSQMILLELLQYYTMS